MALTLLELPVAMLGLIFQFVAGARTRTYFGGRGQCSAVRYKVHLDMPSVIRALCPVSSAARALVLGTPVFYRDYNCGWNGRPDKSRATVPSRPA
eukprot:14464-Eustigmatos_ZCMA.PRE.1